MPIKPLITVITPFFNGAKFLDRVVQCVRLQKSITYEHIFINDASNDNSLEILSKLALSDSRIKIISLDSNVGPSAARNLGLKAASGRFISFLDVDDLWLPEKSKIQSDFMLKNNYGLTFTDYRFISENGKKIGTKVIGPNKISYTKHLMTRSGLGCLTVMIDRKIHLNFTFPNNSLGYQRAEDFFAWADLLRKNNYAHRCPFDLAAYSIVQGSRSSNILLKQKVILDAYRSDHFSMSFLESYFFFICYIISASYKRLKSRPRYNTSEIHPLLADGWILSKF